MAEAVVRSDPIHVHYYAALHKAERCGNWTFNAAAMLSIAVLFIDGRTHPAAHQALNTAFAVSVFAVFLIGLVSRFYWMARAEHARLQELLGSAFDTLLTHMQTEGYYNNDERDPVRRIAAMTMENAFFSKSIALRMSHGERVRVGVYVLIYFVAVTSRTTEIGLVVALSQIVFSEQILVRWIKLEWLRSKCEETYECLSKLFLSSAKSPAFRGQAFAVFTTYEAQKSNAAVTLSNAVFKEMNPALSAEWNQIRTRIIAT